MRRASEIAVSIVLAALVSAGCGDTDVASGDECDVYQPPTAANTLIWTLGAVQQASIPDDVLQNGLDDPLGCAYEQICEEQRSVITRDEFVRTVGAAVSEMLTADSFAGPSVYTDRGLDAEHEGQATLDPDLESTWVDVLVTRYERVDERTVVSGSGKDERWRVELVREEGDWRLCGFAPLGR